MQALALFSEPVVRAVDALVGSTNVMKVDVTDDRGVVRTLEHGHDDLETAVGLATAAFGKELLDGAVAPGIYWPSDLPPDVSDRICDVVREDAGTFLWEGSLHESRVGAAVLVYLLLAGGRGDGDLGLRR
ncbi:hypothetical protein JL722_7844 [Aureococcus anophagefferens]|nr:hypothetical protein JL722_7844 [Aureococcus anophagefferens]